MLVKVKALTNGYHQKYQKKGSEFFYDAPTSKEITGGIKPVIAKWMKLIEVVKIKDVKKPKKAKKEAE